MCISNEQNIYKYRVRRIFGLYLATHVAFNREFLTLLLYSYSHICTYIYSTPMTMMTMTWGSEVLIDIYN